MVRSSSLRHHPSVPREGGFQCLPWSMGGLSLDASTFDVHARGPSRPVHLSRPARTASRAGPNKLLGRPESGTRLPEWLTDWSFQAVDNFKGANHTPRLAGGGASSGGGGWAPPGGEKRKMKRKRMRNRWWQERRRFRLLITRDSRLLLTPTIVPDFAIFLSVALSMVIWYNTAIDKRRLV